MTIDGQPRQGRAARDHIGRDKARGRKPKDRGPPVQQNRAAHGKKRNLAVVARHFPQGNRTRDLIDQLLTLIHERGGVTTRHGCRPDFQIDLGHARKCAVHLIDLQANAGIGGLAGRLDLGRNVGQALCQPARGIHDTGQPRLGLRSGRRLDQGFFETGNAACQGIRLIRRSQGFLELQQEPLGCVAAAKVCAGQPQILKQGTIHMAGDPRHRDADPRHTDHAGRKPHLAPCIAFGQRVRDV